MWVTPSWSRKTHGSSAGHTNRNESTATWWTREKKTLPEGATNKLVIRAIPSYGGSFKLVLFHKGLISISHDDVTNIYLCIYRDTPKSARLSAVLVIHRCLTLCLCVRACVTEGDVICLTNVRLLWHNTHLHSQDFGRVIPGLPDYYNPNSSCLLTVVHFLAFPVVWY